MTSVRALIVGGWAAWAVLAALAAPATAEDPRLEALPYAYNGDYNGEEEHGYDEGAALEQIAPPRIEYEDFAGPDPILDGSAPPTPPPAATAAEQRIQELRGELPAADPQAADAPAVTPTPSILNAIVALCVVLGLIVLCLYAVRRFGARTPLLAGAALGQILGRVHLTPKASLHFVRTGGKVLVVGVTQESVHLVETFDADAFESVGPPPALPAHQEEGGGEEHPKAASFLAQLREQSNRMRQPAELSPGEDGDIATLRGDIERLQRMLRDATRE